MGNNKNKRKRVIMLTLAFLMSIGCLLSPVITPLFLPEFSNEFWDMVSNIAYIIVLFAMNCGMLYLAYRSCKSLFGTIKEVFKFK